MVKIIRTVVYIKDGVQHRLYKTRRSPTRFYYWSSGKRVYVDEKLITKDMIEVMTF